MAEQFSIWIVPPVDIQKTLQGVVNKLAQEHNAPVFEPHMTLLGDIVTDKKTMLEKAHELAGTSDPFPLTLGEISFSTTYFQSVFVRVRPTASLMDLNMKTKETFGRENTVFMPHISLLYGNHAMEERERAVSELELPTGLSFTAEALTIIPATENPDDWKSIATIPFKKS